jgi:DNA modification methylase/HEAT repeat protein
MLNKQAIEHLKKADLSQLYHQLREAKQAREILFILENLGHLPNDFDGSQLIAFVKHENAQVRMWAIKNLAKIKDEQYLTMLFEIARFDTDTIVRREAVSAIGRLRQEKNIKYLLPLLQDNDPKVVLQAIRGLLYFKDMPRIGEALQALATHPNETIHDVIKKEFPAETQTSKIQIPHAESPAVLKNCVVLGDVRDVLQYIPDESIHLTFTSPPYYNARDYSIYASYQAYLDFLTEVFQAVHRVTKEGRFLIVNTSPVIVPRVSRAHSSKRYPIPFDLHARLVNIGWEFIDDIVWAKPETSVKNRNAGFLQHRKPLGYKPNPVTEYLMVYRKQTDKLLDWNMRQYAADTIDNSKIVGDYETSNLWRIDPTFDRVHSAVFPVELCRRVIQFYSYEADLIFDPFGGSGTLGKAAREMKRHFFLTEQEPEYFKRIQERIGQGDMFEAFKPKFYTLDQLRHLTAGE